MMKFNEGLIIIGILQMRIWKDGKLIEDTIGKNLIVNGGREAIANLIGGNGTNKHVSKIAFGTNGDAPIIDNTALTGQFTKAITGSAYPATGSVEFTASLETTEFNGNTIREFALICEDNTLFSRKVRSPIDKTSAIRIDLVWTINF